jgi:hypothetical protein
MWLKRGIVAAAAAMGVLVASVGVAVAVPYSNGLTLTVGTTTFTFTSCNVAIATGSVSPTSCGSLQLVPVIKNGQFGFAINSLISATGAGSQLEIDLTYTADDLNLATAFDGVTLSQTGSSSPMATVDDTVRSQGGTLEAALHTDGTSPVDTDPTAAFLGRLNFTQKISVTGSAKCNGNVCTNVTNQISLIQIIPSVHTHRRLPEPGSLATVGTGLLAVSWAVSRRRRAARAQR